MILLDVHCFSAAFAVTYLIKVPTSKDTPQYIPVKNPSNVITAVKNSVEDSI
jgi:hypothetical protein